MPHLRSSASVHTREPSPGSGVTCRLSATATNNATHWWHPKRRNVHVHVHWHGPMRWKRHTAQAATALLSQHQLRLSSGQPQSSDTCAHCMLHMCAHQLADRTLAGMPQMSGKQQRAHKRSVNSRWAANPQASRWCLSTTATTPHYPVQSW